MSGAGESFSALTPGAIGLSLLTSSILDKSILGLARPAKALAPTDSAARAAGLFRALNLSSLPVVENGRVAGVVSEDAVLGVVAEALRGGADQEAARATAIGGALTVQTVFVHRDQTVGQVVDVFRSTTEDVLPVVDDYGGFYGVVSRADMLAYLSGSLRPANVAGMATPLGVYLTNGSVRAGAGNLGLFLSGIALGINVFLSWLLVWGLASAAEAVSGLPVRAVLEKPFVPGAPKWLYAAQWLSPIAAIGFIMLFIRLSPLSGYHAAEHMTVHAIETGEELTSQHVQSMSRVHARCGTNLLAAATVFVIIAGSFSGDVAIIVALLIVVFGWRSIGGLMQQIATTKTPTPKQLENGVRVGRELVSKFQEHPNFQARGFARIWNMGLLQSMGGLICIFSLAALVAKLFHFVIPF